VLQRRRRAADQAVEQRVKADAGRRADRDDRVEVALGDRLLQVGHQGVGRDLLAAQVAVHEGLVLALGDDALDQRVSGRRRSG
jgi:MoxR-like ATPase